MSGSFERQIYDPRSYYVAVKQSTAPYQWTLDPIRSNHCNPCRFTDVGQIGYNGVSLNHKKTLVDVESNLQRVTYRHSHDPARKFIPALCPHFHSVQGGKPCGPDCCPDKMHHFNECSIGSEYTHLTNPSCTLRGTGWNRFQPICMKPQDRCRWDHPSYIGINYRMVVKDNHVQCKKTQLK